MKGRIIKIISNDYTVLALDQVFTCKARGRFRNEKIKPVVGDLVKFDPKELMISEVYKRTNELQRPTVSNVDQAIIVTSVFKPDFDTNLLDKLLVMVEYNQIHPIICFTKLDLISGPTLRDIKKHMKYYKKIGYKVVTNTQLLRIKRLIKNE